MSFQNCYFDVTLCNAIALPTNSTNKGGGVPTTAEAGKCKGRSHLQISNPIARLVNHISPTLPSLSTEQSPPPAKAVQNKNSRPQPKITKKPRTTSTGSPLTELLGNELGERSPSTTSAHAQGTFPAERSCPKKQVEQNQKFSIALARSVQKANMARCTG